MKPHSLFLSLATCMILGAGYQIALADSCIPSVIESVDFTVVAPIVANGDSLAVTEGSTGTVNVFANDTYNSGSVTSSDVTVALTGSNPIGASLNTNGVLTIPSSAPKGTYSLQYQICDIIAPTNCSNAIISLTITASSSNTPGFGGGGGGSYGSIPNSTSIVNQGNSIIDATIFNQKIGNSCFSRGNEKTVDQGVPVSDFFKKAHQMLFSYRLTKRKGTKDYNPYSQLTREETAKFVVEFAEKVLCRKKTKTYTNNFIDIEREADPSLLPFIKDSYEYAIFWGDKGQEKTTFRPKDIISRDELTATLIRLLTNRFYDESPDNKWADAYNRLLQRFSVQSSFSDTERGSVAEVIYDLYKNNNYLLKDVGYVIADSEGQ